MTTPKKNTKKASGLKEVVVRHGLFRYHEDGTDPYLRNDDGELGKPIVMVKHAERGQTIFVNESDFARGMQGGAFFPKGTILDGGPNPLVMGSDTDVVEGMTPAGEPIADQQEDFEFAGASDEEALQYMERHEPDEVIAKSAGEDPDVIEKVLRLEYQRTNGDPNPQIRDQLVDVLGDNPEEDADGNWINEPDEEEKTEAEKQQTKARTGKGRSHTARSGGKNA